MKKVFQIMNSYMEKKIKMLKEYNKDNFFNK
jgi:hypothetical protein